jgi:hypothetical protein
MPVGEHKLRNNKDFKEWNSRYCIANYMFVSLFVVYRTVWCYRYRYYYSTAYRYVRIVNA